MSTNIPAAHTASPSVKSYGDVCRISVDASMRVNTAQAETLKRLDRDDVIDGCVDAMNGE